MTAQAKTKYGVPVSGRVDVLLHKRLKDEADKYGLTMSKMVDTALSQWAQTSEIRKADQQLRAKVKQLESQLKVTNENKEKWKVHATSFKTDLTQKIEDNQELLVAAKQTITALKSKKTKLDSKLNSINNHYAKQLEKWQKSVMVFIDDIAKGEQHKEQLTKSFKTIYKDV